MRFSLEGKLTAWSVLLAIVAMGIYAGLHLWLGSIPIALMGTVFVVVPIGMIAARSFTRPIVETVAAIGDGIASMKDRDFSVSIAPSKHLELKGLIESYNGLGQLLRDERQGLYQRELLLDTVIQATPLAMVLTNASDRVVYSNVAARQSFLGGRKLEGLSFTDLLNAAPDPLRQAVATQADSLFTVENEGESDIYHL